MKQYRIYRNYRMFVAIKAGFSWPGFFLGIFYLPISFISEAGELSTFIDHVIHIAQFIAFIFIIGLIGFFIGIPIINLSDEYVWGEAFEHIRYFGVLFLGILVLLSLLDTLFPDIKNASNLEAIYYIYLIGILIFPVSNIIFGFFANTINKKLCEASEFTYGKIINAATKSSAIDLFREERSISPS